MISRVKLGIFFKSIWNGILGISTEILMTIFFVAAGFTVCFLWWSFFR